MYKSEENQVSSYWRTIS